MELESEVGGRLDLRPFVVTDRCVRKGLRSRVLDGVPDAVSLIILGGFLLAGFAADVLGRRIYVPRVTLLLLLGFLAGPSVWRLVPNEISQWFSFATLLALSILGFHLGERFLGKRLRSTGKSVAFVSLAEVMMSAACVFGLLWAFGVPIPVALLLASIAPATDPAATMDVAEGTEASGPLTNTLLGVVAIDDAWGVILFSLLVVLAGSFAGPDAAVQAGPWAVLGMGVWEIAGGLLLGSLVGVPMSMVTGRIKSGELTIVETLGFVLLCSGLALQFHLSYVMACMAMGATVSNLAHHHCRPFHAIKEVEQPFLVVFFVLAGFQFQIDQLANVGWIGLGYIVGRVAGKVVGGYLGARMARAPRTVSRHIGFCLLPQAGIALGLALMVAERFPAFGAQILTTIVGTTFVFELLGPVVTRWQLQWSGETGHTDSSD
ncbi:K(+)/H(+) antiporter YhaU [Crateriforma conspicua]|uniref:K(+)/H(+) antiporter YhaU n=1 Tax=Crateriforma conspicua TaxID=2527996 RepID=A0A5C5Y5K9_9PLAN|nr:K(+)/H(+) antiporter YhaU [Crateriforma conspicua]TWT70003.1 K(+)/H(+) antiporter YhaU [Crateriforma conspicua]